MLRGLHSKNRHSRFQAQDPTKPQIQDGPAVSSLRLSFVKTFTRAVSILILGLLGLAAGACIDEPRFVGVVFDPPEPAPALRLPYVNLANPASLSERASEDTFDLKNHKNSVVLIFFGYTHCPDLCPTTLATWKRVKQRLGSDTIRVKFVFVSVDPERDTALVAATYARTFDPSFIGLAADSAHLMSFAKLFGVTAFQDVPPEVLNDTTDTVEIGTYTVSHSSETFMIDTKGQLRLLLKYGTSAEDVLRDIRILLRE